MYSEQSVSCLRDFRQTIRSDTLTTDKYDIHYPACLLVLSPVLSPPSHTDSRPVVASSSGNVADRRNDYFIAYGSSLVRASSGGQSALSWDFSQHWDLKGLGTRAVLSTDMPTAV